MCSMSNVRPPELLGNEKFDGMPDQLFLRIPEEFARLGVAEDDPPITVHDNDGIIGCFKKPVKNLVPL